MDQRLAGNVKYKAINAQKPPSCAILTQAPLKVALPGKRSVSCHSQTAVRRRMRNLFLRTDCMDGQKKRNLRTYTNLLS